ncbi:MAG: response regulator [Anaerolineales bacterium]
MAPSDKIRIMIVDDIAETREQLRKLLSFDPDIEVVAMVGSGEEAVQVGEEVMPHVVLMDINLPQMDGITATSKLLEVVPTAQVIMLSVQGESDYMRRAMMAGARDYLTKPPSADELLDAIHRMAKLLPRSATDMVQPKAGAPSGAGGTAASPVHQAKVITFYSPKGGTGSTTLAVNTAIALQNMLGGEGRVALVDANLQFGDVAVFMKLQPTRTLSDLAPRAHEMDLELLNTVMVPHPSGLKVLAAPPAPEEAEAFQDGGVDEMGGNRLLRLILDFMRDHFDYIFIDTAHPVDNVLLSLLDISDMMTIVTRPVIPEIRGARMFVELLQKLNINMYKVALVINSVDNKRMGIQPEAIERAMMPALAHIPLDERVALRAANYGVPFVLHDSKSALSQAVLELSKGILAHFETEVEEAEESAEAQQRRVGLGRLL